MALAVKMILFPLLISLVQIVVFSGVLYYYFLLIASIPKPQLVQSEGLSPQMRFAILIPAHNEAAVIGNTVETFLALDYPREMFDILVVADHCDDDTANVARGAGAICYERKNGERGRKGFALAWLIDVIFNSAQSYDAFIIMDADSQTNQRFLAVMNQAVVNGNQAIQGQHIISDGALSIYNKFAAIDMRLNNRLRNRAKHNLGLSCRLMGDAMCFSAELMRMHKWSTFSLTEDMEFGLNLLLNGTKVIYAHEAISYGQAAGGWQNASKQRLRWSGGFLNLRRRLGIGVFWTGIKRLNPALLDRGIELVLPTYSTLVIVSLAVLSVQLSFPGMKTLAGTPIMILIVSAWFLLPMLGLLLDRAPKHLMTAFFLGPLYLAWRLWIGVLTLIHGKSIEWVRTPRHEES